MLALSLARAALVQGIITSIVGIMCCADGSDGVVGEKNFIYFTPNYLNRAVCFQQTP